MFTQPDVAGVRHETVKANGIDIHVARAGQGPALVLLHGWPEFWYVWHKMVPILAADMPRQVRSKKSVLFAHAGKVMEVPTADGRVERFRLVKAPLGETPTLPPPRR